MNITIFCGPYYPQVHPRAFRANELAKEFVRVGNNVKVICLRTMPDFDYEQYEKETGIKIIRLGIKKGSNVAAKYSSNSILKKACRTLIEYLVEGRFFIHAKKIIPQLHYVEGSDLVIALSTPFTCLYALSKYLEKNGKNFVTIADSGDPFYYSKQSKRAIWFKYIEKKVYKSFDYLTIPTENAIPLYSPLIPRNKIRIIPQGFNMRDLKLYDGASPDIVSFAYAGVFYWDIRNPEFLFDFLESLQMDFRFYVYMRYYDATLDAVLEKYPKLKSKMVLNFAVPHDDLIFELSKMNFLLNIENISNTQMPSKLIDYGMTKRPIFSCKKSSFSPDKFKAFLMGNYEGKYEVDIEDYNIEKIAKQLIELTLNNNE